jgi:hypothetical protein
MALRMRAHLVLTILVVALALTGCKHEHVITAAGDIGGSAPPFHQAETAALIKLINPERVLTLGDNAYPDGTLDQFRHNYDPWWGSFKRRTRPVPGNHEQHSSDVGYDAYFGPDRHNYSYDLGNWHLIALDTNRGDSSALSFLDADLSRQPTGKCLLMYLHHPLHSSGAAYRGGIPGVRSLYDSFYLAGGDVVLSGHEHNYERFARQDPSERPTLAGYRQLVVGTGGNDLRGFSTPEPNSQVRISQYGVVKLVLKQRSYQADFIGIEGARDKIPETGCHL